MFKDVLKLCIIFLLLFVIWGCGTMSKSEEKLSVPQKVSMEMPKALKKVNKKVKKEKSLGFTELKEDVAYLEELRIDIEVTLLFINQVVDEIDERCKKISLNTVCTIPEDELFFIFDKKLSDRYVVLTHEKAEYMIDEELTFGEIKFIKYGNSSKYQYHMTIDTSSDDEKSSETIEWSRDENNILSFYVEESPLLKSEINILYSNEASEKHMVVDDFYLDKRDNSRDDFYFNLLKKSDLNETYTLTARSQSINAEQEKSSFDSKGELSNSGGFLYFNGFFSGEKFKEYETFDKDGNLLTLKYCYEDLDCDMEDEDSWF